MIVNNLSRRAENCALLAFIAGIVLIVISLLMNRFYASTGLASPVFFGALISYLSLLSYFGLKMQRRALEEKLENENIVKSAGELFSSDRTLFGEKVRAFEQFEKFFLPSLTVLLVIGEAFLAFVAWHVGSAPQWKHVLESGELQMGTLFGAGAIAFFLFLLGSYCAGIASEEGNTKLRPVSSLLIFASFHIVFVIVSFIAAYIGIKSESWNFRNPDPFILKSTSVILALLAIDHIIGIILYFYRPEDLKGKELPIYESRIAGFFSKPETAFENLNEILEYQFGIRISKEMLANFAVSIFLPLLAFQILSLLLLSCVAVVPAQKRAFIERFGKLVRSDLSPGLHFKLPWPIESISNVPADKIFSFNYGSLRSPNSDEASVSNLLWNSLPEDAPLFLTSPEARMSVDQKSKAEGRTGTASMKLIAADINVRYIIEKPQQYKYSCINAEKILRKLASNALLSYLFVRDGYSLYGQSVSAAEKLVASKINNMASELGLGIKVIDVSFIAIQPPSKSETVLTFHKTMIEEQNSITEMNDAEGYANKLLPSSEAMAFSILSSAEAYSSSRTCNARAQSESFAMKMELYKKHGKIYSWISYIDILSKELALPSKIIVATDMTDEVISLDLKNEFNPELLDMASPQSMEK